MVGVPEKKSHSYHMEREKEKKVTLISIYCIAKIFSWLASFSARLQTSKFEALLKYISWRSCIFSINRILYHFFPFSGRLFKIN